MKLNALSQNFLTELLTVHLYTPFEQADLQNDLQLQSIHNSFKWKQYKNMACVSRLLSSCLGEMYSSVLLFLCIPYGATVRSEGNYPLRKHASKLHA